MALPILLTVGALGVGWVALSKERAKLPGTSGEAPVVGDGAATVPEAAASNQAAPLEDVTAGTLNGQAIVADPTLEGSLAVGTSEQNQSTGGSDPATQPGGFTILEPQKVETYTMPTPAQILYGTGKVTRQQEAAAITELGPMMGVVV